MISYAKVWILLHIMPKVKELIPIAWYSKRERKGN